MNSANKTWIKKAVNDIIQEAISAYGDGNGFGLKPDLEGVAEKLLIEAFNRGTVSGICKD
jgi:hypothetical protein